MLKTIALTPQNFIWGLVLALILGVITAGSAVWYVKGLQIDVLNLTHSSQMAEMELKVAKTEAAAAAIKSGIDAAITERRNELDQTYNANLKALSDSVSRLSNIRLRDPAAGGNSGPAGSQGSASSSDVGDTTGSGLLSQEASQFLWSFAGESQEYLNRLNQCKIWESELRAQSAQYAEEIKALKK